MTPHRITKKRALERAGFVHVAGWVTKEAAEKIAAMIEADAADVAVAAQRNP